MIEMTNVERRRAGLPRVLILGATLAAAACGSLLDVELPGEIEESALNDPANAEALVTSAVGAFECFFGNYVLLSANVGDELMVAGSFATFFPYDQRDLNNDAGGYPESGCGGTGGLYTPANQTRWMADETIRRLEGFTDAEVPGRTALLAKTYAYSGLTYLIFGQSWCAMAVDGGPLIDPPEILTIAEERFDQAIALGGSAGTDDIVTMSYLGRARVNLLQGEAQAAVEDAEQVPAGFVKYASRSDVDNTRRNKLYELNHLDGQTVPEPGYWNLEWKGVPDPRVQTEDTGDTGDDSLTPWWLQFKYTSRTDPFPIARYNEARLIIAEAEGGQTAVDIINELHTAAGLPPFDPATDGSVEDHLIQERARELFLEGHRHYDMLRFDLPFPSGSQPWTGRPYRETTCFPIPSVERDSNPNIP
jgi:hypothetical protein